MLKESIAHNIISQGLKLGAHFVDVFVEKNRSLALSYTDKKIKDIKSGTDFGVGIRVIYGHQAIYGYSNSLDQEELLNIVQTLCSLHGNEQDLEQRKLMKLDMKSRDERFLNFSQNSFSSIISHVSHTLGGYDREVDLEEKIQFLKNIDSFARKSPSIVQVDASALQRWQEVEIFDSEGLYAQDQRNYTRIFATAIARDGGEQATAFTGPAGLGGWEIAKKYPPEVIAELIAKRALTVLKAKPCPAGKFPVVLDNGFGGVIFHEACGHLLETTSVEKKASVFHDKMNEMIAHSSVSAVDDGTIGEQYGSLRLDDEGMPTQKTQLIKEGKLVSFLVDRIGEMKTGFKRTGSARRQSYKYAPASRMRNTFIEPGPYTLDELVSSVDYGLYAKAMGGGSVSPGTGEFNFAVEEAYIIEKGKIKEAVKGATLIGTGPEVLKKISMVGNNFKLEPGMCGSVSGSIPVTVGQAALKVDEILVGGKAK